MRKRKLILIALTLVMTLVLTGCGNKTVISTDDFTSIMEKNGLTITDVKEQYSEYDYVKEATVAQSSDGWQIEFYVISDEGYATSMYNNNKTTFESFKGNSSSESSVSIGNYSSYSLTSSGYYMYICRVENTLLYVKVPKEYKSNVESLIKELEY